MRGRVVSELDVDASAHDIWAVYSSHDLPRLIIDLQPGVFEKIDVLEGDGGQGTILHVFLAGTTERSWKEKFVRMDDRTRTKVIHQIEGGFIGMGFKLYESVFHIIEKGPHKCTIESTVNYEVDQEHSSNTSIITADVLYGMATAIANYVLDKKATKHC